MLELPLKFKSSRTAQLPASNAVANRKALSVQEIPSGVCVVRVPSAVSE